MNYKFPLILNISNVLPAIAGRDEFVVAERGPYTIINYNVMMADTFPPVVMRHEYDYAAIRRECRGITFDSKTGDIIRRPLHKFFNVSEKDETQLRLLNFDQEHYADVKLDGSMCAVMRNPETGLLVWGTKMCSPDFHELIENFVSKSGIEYEPFCNTLINQGYTPIFEYMSRKKRIVIDYPEDNLVLLAVRDIVTGGYTYEFNEFALAYDIPLVESIGKVEDPDAFMQYVHDLKGAEGFVIRWSDGHRVKVKAHEYIQIHKAKEAILQDRNIIELILDDKLDDIKAHLLEDDRNRLTKFEDEFNKYIKRRVHMIWTDVQFFKSDRYVGDRKGFAINFAPKCDPYTKPIMFTMWDKEGTKAEVEEVVRNMVRNNLTKTSKYEEIRDAWFPGVLYNV